ncbi:MAG: hypothetical protein WCQ89_14600, partial [Verrucomicrobiota bacterium]
MQRLGRARESQLRELLRSFNGQVVDGAWFGADGALTLPLFSKVSPYRSPDGQLEVDALAELAASIKEHGLIQP